MNFWSVCQNLLKKFGAVKRWKYRHMQTKINNVENFNKMLCTLNKHGIWNLARKENSKCLNDLTFFLIPAIFSVALYEFCSWLLSCSEIKRLQRLCVSTLPQSRLHKTSNQIWSYSFASWHDTIVIFECRN